ncbi:hypothetical protein [Lentilactobacillus hilgardii]|jgi:hypothetical protein|nr:hypothetical protein [Lentilactobacillus hilgardii]EEI72230.1 hypothetical protein HMPREF0496_0508 [Lentilactobacillus hilgardii ATCC 27305]
MKEFEKRSDKFGGNYMNKVDKDLLLVTPLELTQISGGAYKSEIIKILKGLINSPIVTHGPVSVGKL